MMGPRKVAMIDIVRKRIRITGVVQGVGFRPFVWRRATRLHLSGWVENDAAGVVVEVQGVAAAVERFLDGLAAAVPPLAHVTALDITDTPHAGAIPGERFTILESAVAAGPRRAVVPPDIAPCGACLAELDDPADRRHGYAFINCTDCGPRFTIIDTLPYDRRRTTMRSFAMCPACEAEYRDPASRRFHAQPNACPTCGPAALRAGGIVAVKGVGGFHLACDDSVIRCVAGLPLPLRRSRGHAPLPIRLATGGPPVLAVGGELKATLCLARDHEAHVASLLAEHGRDAAGSPGVIGVCFDGTGYGSNGTILGASSSFATDHCRGVPRISCRFHSPGATSQSAIPGGWRSPYSATPASPGTTRSRLSVPLPPATATSSHGNSTGNLPAPTPRAWGDCSTPWPR